MTSPGNIARRVARRYVASLSRTALIQPFDKEHDGGPPHDPEKDIEEGEEAIKKALPLANRAVAHLKSLESDVKEVQRDGIKIIEQYIEALNGVDPKKLGPYIAASHEALAKLKSDSWYTLLGYSSGLTQFIKVAADLPRKLRAYFKKLKGTEPVNKLEAFYTGDLSKVAKAHSRVQASFNEMNDLGYDIWKCIEYVEILPPISYRGGVYMRPEQDTSQMEVYNNLWYEVKSVAQYMTTYPEKAEVEYASLVSNLEEMGKILDAILRAYVASKYQDPDAVLKSKGR